MCLPATKKSWFNWTSFDTTVLIVATVAVLEFIGIGYFVLKHNSDLIKKVSVANHKGYAAGHATGHHEGLIAGCYYGEDEHSGMQICHTLLNSFVNSIA